MTDKPKVGKLKLDKKFSDKLEMIMGAKTNSSKKNTNQKTKKHL